MKWKKNNKRTWIQSGHAAFRCEYGCEGKSKFCFVPLWTKFYLILWHGICTSMSKNPSDKTCQSYLKQPAGHINCTQRRNKLQKLKLLLTHEGERDHDNMFTSISWSFDGLWGTWDKKQDGIKTRSLTGSFSVYVLILLCLYTQQMPFGI